jgi:hypothetical protein
VFSEGESKTVVTSVEAGLNSVDRRLKSQTHNQRWRRSIAPFLTEIRCGGRTCYRKPVAGAPPRMTPQPVGRGHRVAGRQLLAGAVRASRTRSRPPRR